MAFAPPPQQPLGRAQESAAGISTVAVIGAGPRGLMLLERLAAHHAGLTAASDSAAPGLHVHLIDPHPPGPGRIWRREQSPLLRLNSTLSDVTVFPDDSCELGAPAPDGLTLAEWVRSVTEGYLDDVPGLDEITLAEAARLTPTSFPSRRLHSVYLTWALQRVLDALPSSVQVSFHADVVHAVEPPTAPNSDRTLLRLASGERLEVDAVVHTVGHTDARPATEAARLTAVAERHGLTYHPPAYTADDDHADLAPQQDVIVRGLGLAAIDLVVLLTEGRGGRFLPAPGHEDEAPATRRLVYAPSGREPHLLIGSRRGVPYRSKSVQALGHAPEPLSVFTPEVLRAAAERGESWDLLDDAWPLIATELHLAHHRELFTHHPDRVHGDLATTERLILTEAWDSPALREHLASVVPDPLDRFHVLDWHRPLQAAATATRAEMDDLVTEHVRADLQVHTAAEHTATLAVWHRLLQIHVVLAEAPADLFNRRTTEQLLPVTWQGFFSYLASGPPPERLQELLALAEAGVVGFLGPDVSVSTTERQGRTVFSASSPAVAEVSTATALVDAWLPATDVTRTTDPALADLATRAGVLGGRIRVDPPTGRVLDPDGAPLASEWALGAPTSTPDAGAFSRPRMNSLPFRSTDRTAADVLAHLTRPAPPDGSEHPGRPARTHLDDAPRTHQTERA